MVSEQDGQITNHTSSIRVIDRMPELPEVEMFRRYAEATCLRYKVKSVEISSPEMLQGVTSEDLVEAIVDGRFLATRRHGKYLFLEVDRGGHLIIHFGMTGSVRYHRSGGVEHPHVRMLLHFVDGNSMAFHSPRKLGRIGLTDDIEQFVIQRGLGPDALAIGREEWRQRIEGKRGKIKGLLLDQSVVAGVGNEYSDEILHQCGLHPERRANDLGPVEIPLIHRRMREILLRAIDLEADWSRLPDHYLIPRRREGVPCPRCGGALSRLKVSPVDPPTSAPNASCERTTVIAGALPSINRGRELAG